MRGDEVFRHAFTDKLFRRDRKDRRHRHQPVKLRPEDIGKNGEDGELDRLFGPAARCHPGDAPDELGADGHATPFQGFTTAPLTARNPRRAAR